MKPENPVHEMYKGAVRWLCWYIGNYHQDRIFDEPRVLVEAFSIFNNNLNIEDFDNPPCPFIGDARDRALDYIKWKTQDEDEPNPPVTEEEKVYEHFSDYRTGVCQLSKLLAYREFTHCDLKEPQKGEDWYFGGTEMERIFAVYTNNINLDKNNMTLNHEQAVSRVEKMLLYWWDEDEDSVPELEEWETELTM